MSFIFIHWFFLFVLKYPMSYTIQAQRSCNICRKKRKGLWHFVIDIHKKKYIYISSYWTQWSRIKGLLLGAKCGVDTWSLVGQRPAISLSVYVWLMLYLMQNIHISKKLKKKVLYGETEVPERLCCVLTQAVREEDLTAWQQTSKAHGRFVRCIIQSNGNFTISI